MKVISVDRSSPLFGKVDKRFRLVRINGEAVDDNLDCRYKLAEDFVKLEFIGPDNKSVSYNVKNDLYGDLGLEFEADKLKICKNKCVFCFVHQQPKGMRRALYLRDDDFRYSFTDGNFITLSNITKADLERIVAQRLSPLYVSVHTTDEALRRKLFGNKKLSAIMPQLKYLADHGITVHTQVVLCPGINDGDYLIKTINDLAGLYPKIASLGVVPVGLTRYRKNLPRLEPYDKPGAGGVIDMVHSFQQKLLSKYGARIVYLADEFYIQAKMELPKLYEYEEMPQFENGIGMMRSLLTDFNRKKRFLKGQKLKKKIAVLTGMSAYSILKDNMIEYLRNDAGLKIDIHAVKNRFWGRNVTVSGLLTGRDIMFSLKNEMNKINKKNKNNKYDIILLPPNCLNMDGLFLDDTSLTELENKIKVPLKIGSYSMVDTIREVLN